MSAEAKEFIRFAIGVGVVVMLATSTVTKPGWSQSGERIHEVERHFGWPCEYYADIWRNNSPNNGNLVAYMTLVPLSAEMQFGYSDFSVAALMLNALFVVCFVVLVILLGRITDRKRVEGWVAAVAAAAIATCGFVVYMSEHVGAFGL